MVVNIGLCGTALKYLNLSTCIVQFSGEITNRLTILFVPLAFHALVVGSLLFVSLNLFLVSTIVII